MADLRILKIDADTTPDAATKEAWYNAAVAFLAGMSEESKKVPKQKRVAGLHFLLALDRAVSVYMPTGLSLFRPPSEELAMDMAELAKKIVRAPRFLGVAVDQGGGVSKPCTT